MNENWLTLPSARKGKRYPPPGKTKHLRLGETAAKLLHGMRKDLHAVDRVMTTGRVIDILVAHWEQHPPDPFWILEYQFRVRFGRKPGGKGRIARSEET